MYKQLWETKNKDKMIDNSGEKTDISIYQILQIKFTSGCICIFHFKAIGLY